MKLHELKEGKIYIGEDGDEYERNYVYLQHISSRIYVVNFKTLTQDFTEKKEPLTFERIRKECVSGKHLLVSDIGIGMMFLGFTRGNMLATDGYDCSRVFAWTEEDIKNWEIKPYETTK